VAPHNVRVVLVYVLKENKQ